MFRRIRRLQEARRRAAEETPAGDGRATAGRGGRAGKLSFKSPLTRLMAMQVGRGASASLMQQVGLFDYPAPEHFFGRAAHMHNMWVYVEKKVL